MKRTRSGIAVVLAIALVQVAFAQGKRKDPASWAPADAVAYLGITDTARLWADFKKTADYKMMTDEDLADSPAGSFWGNVTRKLKERLAEVLDVSPEELRSPLAGRLALYLTAPPGAGPDDLEPALVAGVGDAEVMQKYFDAALSRLKEAADDHETVSAGSNTIHVFTSEPGEEEEEDEDFDLGDYGKDAEGITRAVDEALEKMFSAEQMPEKLAVCLTEDRLVVAGSAEQVRSALAREKRGQTLADSDDHKALLRELRPTGEVRLLVNLPRIFGMVRGAAGGDDESGKILAMLGAGGLRSVVGHVRLGAKSYDGKSELLFLTSGEQSGLAKLLSMENRAVTPPAAVSASTAIFVSLNLNPPELVDQILRMIAQNDPQWAETARASMENVPGPDGQPMNIRKDLIDHLAGPLTLAGGSARPHGANSIRALLTLGHRNRDALTRLVSLIPGVTPRDVHGAQVYERPMMPVAFAVTNDQILVGNTPAVESRLAADETTGLAEDPEFRRAVRLVPKQAWCVIYVDKRKLMEALLELAKKRDELIGDPVAMPLLMLLQMAGVDLDDTAAARKMLEYSRAGIMTIATTTEGMRFTLVQLKPQKK